MQLVIVRHGKYGAGDHLSDDGRQAIASVTDKLKTILTSEPVIRTSPATRAHESGQVIQSILGGSIQIDDELTANYLRDVALLSPEKARAYLASLPTDQPIVLVSHVDICALLLELFGSHIQLDRGEAAIIIDDQLPTKL